MGRVSGRVSGFLIKSGPDLDPLRVFFFKNPYPALFFIGPGKIRPIRVGPGRAGYPRVGFKLPSLVDVGGGNGSGLAEIVKSYPHIKGINFDLPHVVATAPIYDGITHEIGRAHV